MPYTFARYRTPRKIQKSTRVATKSAKVLRDLKALIRNPFNLVTDGRIPDGRANLSLPVKVQQVQQVTMPNDFMDVFFFPGLSNAISYWHNDNFSTQNAMPIGSHGLASNAAGVQKNATGQIVQWRTVSAGLRLSLVNNAITNEGWFECARITLPKESAGWDLSETFAAGNFYPKHVGKNSFIPTDINSLKNHPSYATGKLRDIDHVLFNLRANADVHEFNTLKDGSSTNEAYRYVDEGFDAIWIRVHGVAGTTKLLFNYVLNQEIVYDEAAELARAMTGFPAYSAAAAAIRRYRQLQGTSALTIPMQIDSPSRAGGGTSKKRKMT